MIVKNLKNVLFVLLGAFVTGLITMIFRYAMLRRDDVPGELAISQSAWAGLAMFGGIAILVMLIEVGDAIRRWLRRKKTSGGQGVQRTDPWYTKPWVVRIAIVATAYIAFLGIVMMLLLHDWLPDGYTRFHTSVLGLGHMPIAFTIALEWWILCLAGVAIYLVGKWIGHKIIDRARQAGWKKASKRVVIVATSVLVGHYVVADQIFHTADNWIPWWFKSGISAVFVLITILILLGVIRLLRRLGRGIGKLWSWGMSKWRNRGTPATALDTTATDPSAAAITVIKNPWWRRLRTVGVVSASLLVFGAVAWFWVIPAFTSDDAEATKIAQAKPAPASPDSDSPPVSGEDGKGGSGGSDGSKGGKGGDGKKRGPERSGFSLKVSVNEVPACRRFVMKQDPDAENVVVPYIQDPEHPDCTKIPDFRKIFEADRECFGALRQLAAKNGRGGRYDGTLKLEHHFRWYGGEHVEACTPSYFGQPVAEVAAMGRPVAPPPDDDVEDPYEGTGGTDGRGDPPPEDPPADRDDGADDDDVATFEGVTDEGTFDFNCDEDGWRAYEEGVTRLCDGEHTPCRLRALKRRFSSIRTACGDEFLTAETEHRLLDGKKGILDYHRP